MSAFLLEDRYRAISTREKKKKRGKNMLRTTGVTQDEEAKVKSRSQTRRDKGNL